LREVRDELRVLRGFARAQAVVEVRDVEVEAELRREVTDEQEERGRVRAAGHRHDEGTGREEVVLAHEGEDCGADRSGGGQRWLGWESDPRSGGYESPALTTELPSRRADCTCALRQAAPRSPSIDRLNSASVMVRFFRLQGPHAGRMLSIELAPPRDSGVR
jgi:hypothetical protein